MFIFSHSFFRGWVYRLIHYDCMGSFKTSLSRIPLGGGDVATPCCMQAFKVSHHHITTTNFQPKITHILCTILRIRSSVWSHCICLCKLVILIPSWKLEVVYCIHPPKNIKEQVKKSKSTNTHSTQTASN